MNRAKSHAERFIDWMTARTPAEFALHGDAYKFEEKYFSDFCLTSPRVKCALLEYEVKIDGKWHKTVDESSIGIDGWILKYRRFRKEWLGLCDYRTQTIFIQSGLQEPERTATLLHEMIHAYEFQLPPAFKEWLLLDLYKHLSKRIGSTKLDGYIRKSTHTLIYETQHGILFLLKSLDLDLKRKLELGSVFGYGRPELLNQKS